MIECTTLKFKYEIPSILDVEIVYNITIFTMFYRIVFNFVLFSPGYLVLLTKTCSVVTFQCRRGETSNDHDCAFSFKKTYNKERKFTETLKLYMLVTL